MSDLRAAVVSAIVDGLLAHLVEELLPRHRLIDARVVGDVRRDRQRPHGRVLVHDHRLQEAKFFLR